jgi:hypothetical protein
VSSPRIKSIRGKPSRPVGRLGLDPVASPAIRCPSVSKVAKLAKKARNLLMQKPDLPSNIVGGIGAWQGPGQELP